MRIKTMDITVPDNLDPTTGQVVTIVEVIDARTQRTGLIGGSRRQQPVQVDGLHTYVDAADIGERAFGELLFSGGLIVLPEGRSVAEVVELTVARGLRRAGHNVVAENDPLASDAAPLEVTILEFWAWKEETWPQGETGTYFSAKIKVSGPIEPFVDSPTITSAVKDSPKGFATFWLLRLDTFRGALKKGMEKLVENIAEVAAAA